MNDLVTNMNVPFGTNHTAAVCPKEDGHRNGFYAADCKRAVPNTKPWKEFDPPVFLLRTIAVLLATYLNIQMAINGGYNLLLPFMQGFGFVVFLVAIAAGLYAALLAPFYLVWRKKNPRHYVTLVGGPWSGMRVAMGTRQRVTCAHGYPFLPDGNNDPDSRYVYSNWYEVKGTIAAYTPPVGRQLPGMPELKVSETLAQACVVLAAIADDPLVGNVVAELYVVATGLLYQESKDEAMEAALQEQIADAVLASSGVAAATITARQESKLTTKDVKHLKSIELFLQTVCGIGEAASRFAPLHEALVVVSAAIKRYGEEQMEVERQENHNKRELLNLPGRKEMNDILTVTKAGTDALRRSSNSE